MEGQKTYKNCMNSKCFDRDAFTKATEFVSQPSNTLSYANGTFQKNVDISPYKNEKLPVLFNFSYHFYKLDEPLIFTIRSLDYRAKTHDRKNAVQIYNGMVGWITIKYKPYKIVKLTGWKDQKICDMPIALLQKDVAHDNFKINTHAEFVAVLNNILLKSGYQHANNQITTTKRIFFMEPIGGKPEKW